MRGSFGGADGGADGGANGGADFATALLHICDLGNSVLRPDAQSKLHELRETKPELFKRRDLFLASHELLARFSFPLAIRHRIHQLLSPAAAAFEAPAERAQCAEALQASGERQKQKRSPSPPSVAPVVSITAGLQRRSVRL